MFTKICLYRAGAYGARKFEPIGARLGSISIRASTFFRDFTPSFSQGSGSRYDIESEESEMEIPTHRGPKLKVPSTSSRSIRFAGFEESDSINDFERTQSNFI